MKVPWQVMAGKNWRLGKTAESPRLVSRGSRLSGPVGYGFQVRRAGP